MMALLQTSKAVCDICHSPRRKVTTFRLGVDHNLVEVEVCAEHAKPLAKLIALGRPVSSTGNVRVWTFEEIEARKKAAKNATLNP